jgi:hypothetical protein
MLTSRFNHMLRHSLMNEDARALPVGAACYLCTQDPQLNGTNEKYRFLPLSFRRLSCC